MEGASVTEGFVFHRPKFAPPCPAKVGRLMRYTTKWVVERREVDRGVQQWRVNPQEKENG
jgi:hypothetical protein